MTETDELFYVGSYTQVEGHVPNGNGEGIYAYALDRKTGNLSKKTVTTGIKSPSYIHFDAKERQVYAAEEECEDNNANAYLIAYDADLKDGTLTERSRLATRLHANAHVSIHGNSVLVAAYGSGTVVAMSKNGGNLVSLEGSFKYSGSGPNKERQEAPHAHQALVSPDGKWLFVCDLGSDTIWCHSTSELPDQIPAPIHAINAPPGSGPRHLIFHPSLPNVYVISELTGFVLSYLYNADTGNLDFVGEIDSYPLDYKGERSSSGIRMHPSGNAVYVSNRGHNCICIFPIKHGKIEKDRVVWIPCGGDCPRDFAIDPSGQWLIVANQDDSTLTVFKVLSPDNIDSESKQTFSCNTPTCIAFSS